MRSLLNLHVEVVLLRDYQYDKRKCIEAVRKFMERYKSTNASLYDRLQLRPSRYTITAHVGGWNEAVRLAGGVPGRGRKKEEILESFRKTIAEYGRVLSPSEYRKLSLKPTMYTLYLHGFSYEDAVRTIGLPYHFKSGNIPKGKRLCSMCGSFFTPKIGKQRYCSYNCRDRFKAWKYRTLRELNRRCPQCGGEMDYPLSSHKNKKSPKYCSSCQMYFKDQYLRTKGENANGRLER